MKIGDGDAVTGLTNVRDSEIWINGGHFMFRGEIFDCIEYGDELVEQPFARLMARNQLAAYRHEGFWAPMDTLKEAQLLQALYKSGESPWTRWLREPAAG